LFVVEGTAKISLLKASVLVRMKNGRVWRGGFVGGRGGVGRGKEDPQSPPGSSQKQENGKEDAEKKEKKEKRT